MFLATLVVWRQRWQCQLVSPEYKISTDIKSTAMKSCTNIHVAGRMNPNDLSEMLHQMLNALPWHFGADIHISHRIISNQLVITFPLAPFLFLGVDFGGIQRTRPPGYLEHVHLFPLNKNKKVAEDFYFDKPLVWEPICIVFHYILNCHLGPEFCFSLHK